MYVQSIQFVVTANMQIAIILYHEAREIGAHAAEYSNGSLNNLVTFATYTILPMSDNSKVLSC